MRVLHLSTGASESSAAYRLHRGLRALNIDSYLMLNYKSKSLCDDKYIIQPNNDLIRKIKNAVERLLLKLYPKRNSFPWDSGVINNFNLAVIKKLRPDIVHLHWINQFVSIKMIKKIDLPLVWTFHDSWPMTGGCHIPFDCVGYINECGNCGQLQSMRKSDLSRWIFNKKKRNWKDLRFNIVAPSGWMYKCIEASPLFRGMNISNIPNGLDVDFFREYDQTFARDVLHLPRNRKIIVFGAVRALQDKNKGFECLQSAIELVNKQLDPNGVLLVVFGSSGNSQEEIIYLGDISNQYLLPLIYSAADIVVCPSKSENLSTVAIESISCGTPVVAFDVGGNSDIVRHKKNGYLAKAYQVDDLASGILWSLENLSAIDSDELKISSTKYSIENISKKHIHFYEYIMNQSNEAKI